jgi:putative membrane-bound dehydrogenase-like protein
MRLPSFLSPRPLLGVLLALLLPGLLSAAALSAGPRRLKVLFLGDNGPHRPADRFRQIQPVLAGRGIDLSFTDRATALDPKVLSRYDGLLIYANITRITPEQEKALLDFVASGKGFIPVHCASYCFLNSPKYIELVGAQFRRHGTGVFRTVIAAPDHPVMKGFRGFESWDETYEHTKHNKDRTVLEYRVGSAGKEPWTWVRTPGKGRVFYTAWGHDARTWGNPGFANLLERGIRWAVGADPAVVPPFGDQPAMTALRKDVKPFRYVEAKVPFYPAGERWGTLGKPITQMQLPLPPEESVKHTVTPVDFEVKLFVSEEQLGGGKPICMNWDEKGRLWLALTVDYPNELQPEGKGRDRIVVCEDTKGTGRADKVTVFADKLSIPTSLTFANGGVVVHQYPHTLFLKDTKGDGKADLRKVLFTGWGWRDTHAGPSSLRYGLDNWLYGMVGYSGFRGTVGGERHRFSQGFYRFKPDGSQLEFLRNTNNNSWGVGFSEEGLLFGSTANGNPSVFLPIPNRYYENVRGWSSSVLGTIALNYRFHPITDKVRQVDFHGGFTSAAGHALYTARTYPPEYWNRTAFVSDPTGHLTATFVLQRNGAGYISRNAWNLLASDDEWAAPIMAEVGPDGHVWVIDWYNFIVQHNPTPAGFRTGKGNAYETPLRDKKHGRIYRIVCKKAPPAKPFSLAGASPERLVATLKHDNMLWRLHAQRLLVERGKRDVVPALLKLVGDSGVDTIGLNVGAIHALWTLHGLGALNGAHAEATAAARTALKHKSAGVRRNALAVLPRKGETAKDILGGGLLNDPDAQVRLAALLALAELPPSAAAGAAVAGALSRPENLADRWLADALTSAAAAHDRSFLLAVASRGVHPPGTSPGARRALAVVDVVAEHYARGGPADSVAALLEKLEKAELVVVQTIVDALARGWPKGRPATLTADTEQALVRLLARVEPGTQSSLLKLASAWNTKALARHAAKVVRTLLAAVADDKLSDERRIAAARQVIAFQPGDAKVAAELLNAITPRTPPRLATGLLEAVGGASAAGVGPALVGRLEKLTPTTRAAALRVLLSRTESTRALLDGLDKGKVQWTDLALDQKQALLSHPDGKIAARARKLLARGGQLPNPDRQKVLEELLPLAKRMGNAALGKEVFKKHCATCHTHSGEGNKIGPDLTGMAVHPKEHLLEEIIDPSRSVEGNYRVYTATTESGRVYQGLLASETRTSVELIDATGKKRVLLRENLAALVGSNKSLMPDGFEKQLSRDDLVNLLSFLTQRGKYLPLPLDKVATITSTRGMFYSEKATMERLVFRDWSPKTFKGVPFLLTDPRGGRSANVVLLYSSNGTIPPKMPRSVRLPVNGPAKAIHLLSGVSGWGWPGGTKGSVSLIVRLHYADGKSEDHPLRNGEHFADYIRRVDVPGSTFAFDLRGRQVRYLAVHPKRAEAIKEVELVKGPDRTAPLVVAVTVEAR